MIQCFIKVAQRVPVVEKHGDLCNCDVTKTYEREGGWSGPRNYAIGNNLYKAETDPENFARGGPR